MFVFKVKKGSRQFIKVTENNFNESTKRKYPFVQTIKDKKRHFAYCPACENPVSIVQLYVDKEMIDENKRHVSMHARHIKYDVTDIGEYSQEAYDNCPYANPTSTTSTTKRSSGTTSDELLYFIKSFPDVLDIVMKRDVGIAPNENLFKEMLQTFKDEEGHLFRYVSKYNLPYAFMYMANNQNLMLSKINTSSDIGKELYTKINANSQYCTVSKYGSVFRKKDITEFINISFYFTNFEIDEINGEKYQKFSLVIIEECNKIETEILRKEIKFDQFYYYNLVNKRYRYIEIAKDTYK
jgi:hypothetical protein